MNQAYQIFFFFFFFQEGCWLKSHKEATKCRLLSYYLFNWQLAICFPYIKNLCLSALIHPNFAGCFQQRIFCDVLRFFTCNITLLHYFVIDHSHWRYWFKISLWKSLHGKPGKYLNGAPGWKPLVTGVFYQWEIWGACKCLQANYCSLSCWISKMSDVLEIQSDIAFSIFP